MAIQTDAWKQEVRRSLDHLKKLGVEIRSDLKVAGEDARKEWKHLLEPQLVSVEKLAKELGAASHDAIARTAAALDAFQRSLKPAKKGTAKARRRTLPAKRTVRARA